MAKKRIGVLVFLVFVLFFVETLNAGGYSRVDNVHSVESYRYGFSSVRPALNKKLKNCEYGFLDEICIPGMPSTKEQDVYENKIPDTSLCPQGICQTKEYILISAYSTAFLENLGCIYVFDKETGEYLVTLGLRNDSHLGGITFDGEYVWVCHSDNKSLECIPYSFIQRMVEKNPGVLVDCSNLFACYDVENRPSCITYYDGKLWVATHKRQTISDLYVYEWKDDSLEVVGQYSIPAKVQGIEFDKQGRVYLSCSYGRMTSSYLKIYVSVDALHSNPNYPQRQIEMPPCAEELIQSGNEIFILFESAGEKYFEGTDGKGRSISPIENILIISKNSIFE